MSKHENQVVGLSIVHLVTRDGSQMSLKTNSVIKVAQWELNGLQGQTVDLDQGHSLSGRQADRQLSKPGTPLNSNFISLMCTADFETSYNHYKVKSVSDFKIILYYTFIYETFGQY
jgi:hypothetical protein